MTLISNSWKTTYKKNKVHAPTLNITARIRLLT